MRHKILPRNASPPDRAKTNRMYCADDDVITVGQGLMEHFINRRAVRDMSKSCIPSTVHDIAQRISSYQNRYP